jgi:hypothetical protein
MNESFAQNAPYSNSLPEKFVQDIAYPNSMNKTSARNAPTSNPVNERFCEMVGILTQVFGITH